MDFSSKLLQNAVNEMSQLPGIGKRTALRLVLHLIRESPDKTTYLTEALFKMRSELKFCRSCHNISDVEGVSLSSAEAVIILVMLSSVKSVLIHIGIVK